jgi:hypothetical protein
LAVALANNSTLTSLDVSGNFFGDNGAKELAYALTDNSTLTSLDMDLNWIDDEGVKALARALAHNSTLTSLDIRRNKFGDDGAKVLAHALLNNSTLTSLGIRGNGISRSTLHIIDEVIVRNKNLKNSLARQGRAVTSAELIVRNGKTEKSCAPQPRHDQVKENAVNSPPPSRPFSIRSFADLRQRCSSSDFGKLSLDMTRERALVTAASARDPLRRSAATLDRVARDWRRVVEAQRIVVVGKGEDAHAMGVRDRAVSRFIESSSALEETRKTLLSLTLTAPPSTKDGESADLLSVAEMYDIVGKTSEWISRIDKVVTARMATVSRVRDAFVKAHNKLRIAIGSDSTQAREAAEEVCLERALALEKVAQIPVTPPSPLCWKPANLEARLVASLTAHRSSILNEIAKLQEHQRELMGHGDTCPSTDELEGMRKRLKTASRNAELAEMALRHAVEDDEDTAELAAALDKARADQCVAARAVDAEWLRQSLASIRWPELRFGLGDDVAGTRNIAVFADQSILAKGPPTTRFKVLKGTAPDGTRVALKLFPLGDEASDKATIRFMREAERLRRLRFDHVWTYETSLCMLKASNESVYWSCSTMGEVTCSSGLTKESLGPLPSRFGRYFAMLCSVFPSATAWGSSTVM